MRRKTRLGVCRVKRSRADCDGLSPVEDLILFEDFSYEFYKDISGITAKLASFSPAWHPLQDSGIYAKLRSSPETYIQVIANANLYNCLLSLPSLLTSLLLWFPHCSSCKTHVSETVSKYGRHVKVAALLCHWQSILVSQRLAHLRAENFSTITDGRCKRWVRRTSTAYRFLLVAQQQSLLELQTPCGKNGEKIVASAVRRSPSDLWKSCGTSQTMIPFASPSNPVLDAFYILPKDLLGGWKKKAPVDAKCSSLWWQNSGMVQATDGNLPTVRCALTICTCGPHILKRKGWVENFS